MDRLLQLKNQYPISSYIDVFNSFVARLRSANTHLFDERSSEGHDLISCVCDGHFLYLLTKYIKYKQQIIVYVSQARRTPRRPDIYAYVQDLGIELRKKITTTILSIIIVLRNKIYSSYLFWLLFRQNKIKNQHIPDEVYRTIPILYTLVTLAPAVKR